MPKVEDIFSMFIWCEIFFNLGFMSWLLTIYLWINLPYVKWHSTHHLDKYEYIKVHFGLTQAPAYFQELMTSSLKDFNFAIAYLDDIIIFSKTVDGASFSHQTRLWEIMHCKTLNEVQQMSFLYEGNTIPRTHPQHQGHLTITIKNSSHLEHAST